MNTIKSVLDAFASVLMYPEQDHDVLVQLLIERCDADYTDVTERIVNYQSHISSLSLSAREELYIQTFDLNKAGTLDLGWHLFGEDYNRGLFLVKVRQYLQLFEIPESHELPDHVSQVLRVLGRMSRDDANQFAYACVIPAIEIIGEGIQSENPYDQLVGGLSELLRLLFDVPVGFEDTDENEVSRFQLPTLQ